MTKNTLPERSGNSESLKNNRNSSNAFQLMYHSWRGFVERVLQLILFTVLRFK